MRRRNRCFRRRGIVFLRRAEHLHVILSPSILPQVLVLWVWREEIAATILLRGAIFRDFEDRLLRVDGLGIAHDDRLVEILVVDGVLQPELDVVGRVVAHPAPPVRLPSFSDGAEGMPQASLSGPTARKEFHFLRDGVAGLEGDFAAAVEHGVCLGGNGRDSSGVAADFFGLGRYDGYGVHGSILEAGENNVRRGWEARKRVDHRGTTKHGKHQTAEHVSGLLGESAEVSPMLYSSGFLT